MNSKAITYTVKVDQNGDKIWRDADGKPHRTDGPAIEYASGSKAWLINGQYHRTDGPAIEWANGDKAWLIDGKRHREDGPACEYTGGYKSWWINGKCLSEQEFNARNVTSHDGEVIELGGKKYKLTAI